MPHTNETRERYHKHSIDIGTAMDALGVIVRADCVHPCYREGAQRTIEDLGRSRKAIHKSLEIGRPLEKRVQGKWTKGYLPGDNLPPSFDIKEDERCDWRFEPVPEEPPPEFAYVARLADGSLAKYADTQRVTVFSSSEGAMTMYPGSKVITVRLVPETSPDEE